MKKTVKTGGIGKSPLIRKMNRIQGMEAPCFAGNKIREKCLTHVTGEGRKTLDRREEMIEKYQIRFTDKKGEEHE